MEHVIEPQESGYKLRDILRQVMKVSYSAMKSAKWDNRILVDGVPRQVDYIVQEGQRVTMLWPEDTPVYQLRPYALALHIPYQDEHLMVIDKPAPLASQSSAAHPDDSLENALFTYEGCPESFVYRPVNRLDKGTSGLMVVARTAHAQHRLQQLLHTPSFVRVYQAVTEGIPDPARGVIDAPIGKVDAASIRRIITPTGKPSRTHYQTLQTKNGRALVQLQLETGRTHQIRVHMASIGCPVCGDFLYGTELKQLPGRFALHACALTLLHPFTGEWLHLTSPLTADLAALLEPAHDPAIPFPADAAPPCGC